MKYLIPRAVAIFLVLQAFGAQAESFHAKVIGVTDGDTITILTPQKEQIKVRLEEVDAPEKSQPFGETSKQFLSSLIFGEDVKVDITGTDKYGRSIGKVYHGETDIALQLIKTGHAWAYRQYLKDKTILDAEVAAKSKGLGLWALQEDQRMPPWEWRNGRSTVKPTPSPIAHESNEGLSCAGKRYCREMTSCAEAKFYLRVCGLNRLDGDSDGIPCEKICR